MDFKRAFILTAIFAPAELIAQTVMPVPASMAVQPATQALAPAPVSTSIIAPLPANRAILRAGTDVPVRLTEEVTTKGKKLHVGQRVRMETAEAIVYQGVVAIPSGSPVVGEISDVVNKGMWGKSGHVSLRVLYVTVNGRQIRLSGAIDDKGVAGGVAAVAVSAIVFLPAGFFMTGTSAKLPVGTAFKAFLDEDVPLEMAALAPPPLLIGTPAPPMLVAASPPMTVAAAPATVVPVAATTSAVQVAAVTPPTVVAPVQGPAKAKANTPSGFCYDVPKNYVGMGTADQPALTPSMPACSSLGRN